MIDTDALSSFPWRLFAIAAVCILLAAFGTVAETVMEAAGGRFRALSDPNKGPTGPLERLLDKPDYYVSTALLISRVSIIILAVLSTGIALEYFLPAPALMAAMIVVSAVVIVLGEIVPRTIATQNLVRTAQVIGPPLRLAAWLMTPLLWTLGLITNSVARLFGLRPMARAPLVTEAELMGLLHIGEQEGIIEEDEREMISGIFELEETLAREIMVPRIDIVGVGLEATLDDVVDVMISHGYSRIPLYQENLDHIVGILYVKDMLRALAQLRRGEPIADLRELAREAYFIPETKRINELLHELQAKRVHLAIVVDEYGGTAGLVTIEDLLEEIVGEIRDEFDPVDQDVVQVNPNEALVSGRASIYTLQELFGYDVGRLDVDTVGGFMYRTLERVPVPGDVVLLDSLKLTVTDVSGTRIQRIRVEQIQANNGHPENLVAS